MPTKMRKIVLILVGVSLLAFILFFKKNTVQYQTFSQQVVLKSPASELEKLKGKIAFMSDRDGDWEIYIMNVNGSGLKKLTDNNFHDEYPRFSPDGKWIAFQSNREGHYQIYIMDKNGNNIRRVTNNNLNCFNPEWFPNSERIAFDTSNNGDNIYFVDIKTGKEEKVTDFWYKTILPAISPDGRSMAFTGNKILGWGIYRMDLYTKEVLPLDTGEGACRPAYSPDGQWIAYVSGRGAGKENIWIIKWDGSERKQITRRRDLHEYDPRWSPDGNWIVYMASESKEHGNWEIWIVKIYGTIPIRLTKNPAQDMYPDWTL